MRKATLIDILAAEQEIEFKFYSEFEKFFVLFSECIDALINRSYVECMIPADIESDDYLFYFYAKESYMHAPFAFRSVTVLMAKGQYQEGLNLCRSTIENLINCKYLFFNKEQAKKTLRGDFFSIKDRWEFIAGEGAYQKIYKLLCRTEHKNFGWGNSQPRLNAKFSQQEQFSLIPIYDQKQAGMIINYVLFLVYGYLNLFSLFFTCKNNEVDIEFDLTKRKLNDLLTQQKNKFPEAKVWCLIMEQIVNKEWMPK